MPGEKSNALPLFSIAKSIGESIFYISGNYSKSQPETLVGTNNTYWIVYYKDLDVTFKVKKENSNILDAKKGRIPNF